MTDIIERMWEICAKFPPGSPDRATLVEGADEIERLQASVNNLMVDAKVRAGVVLSEENDRLIDEIKELRSALAQHGLKA